MTSAHVAATRDQVEEHLRMADARRFGQLLDLFDGDRMRLSDVLKACYPRVEPNTQLAQLRNFRTELNRAFREAKLDVAFVVDTKKRSGPEERFCWFEGANAAEPLLAGFVEQQTRITDPAKSVEPRGTPTPARRPVRYVVVSSEKDESTASEFVEMLRVRMLGSRFTAFDGWAPADLVAGESRAAEQQKHEEASQIVIVLMSPSLVADERTRERVARLKGEGRPVFPIPLIAVDPERQELGALHGVESCPKGGRAYRQQRGKSAKEDFALAAWREIETALERVTLRSSPRDVSAAAPSSSLLDTSAIKAWNLPDHLIDARGRISILRLRGGDDAFEREVPEAGAASPPKDESIKAVDYLHAWAIDPAGPPFFALLGDVGIGKTTTCRLLTLRMLEARNRDSTAPLAIYLDLRRFSWDGTTRFSLDSILDEVLRKSFHAGTSPLPSPRDVIEHVQRQGAVALFDGLDEVIVHMPPKLAQDFIRELWRILPPAARKSERESGERRGKLLISCRSHYFRRVWEQNTMLFGEEREGLRSSDYRALVLLPFDTQQVEEYLGHNVTGLDVDRALELIRSVHNLSELAERPFTLSLIGEFLPELERKSQSGALIQGVDLYDAMVTRWLLRDQGKHQFSTVHKELLMERLAAALWAGTEREWSFEQLENWLDDTVDGDDRFRAYRGKEREVLKEDLRTATFLVRPGAERFRFAHTSLQEFFLARHLYRALTEGAGDRWALEMPSDETFEFLVQLFIRDGEKKQIAEKALGALLGQYRPLASEAALRFWLGSATRPGSPRRPERMDLSGAKLNGWQFSGSRERPLDLRSVDLREADLSGATFTAVDLSGVNLSGAKAVRAEFHDVTLSGSSFGDESARADLAGSLWRTCQLMDVDARYAELDGCRFILCHFSRVSWPASGRVPIFAACHDETGEKSTLSRRAAIRLDTFTDHQNSIYSCAVSADGRRVVSASFDGIVRVWDAITTELQLVLEGHRTMVTSCAMSLDGQCIVSGDVSGEVRVWDAASGRILHAIDGFRGSVLACALSDDGRRIYAGTSSQALSVYDTADGWVLRTPESRSVAAIACGISRDGRFIVFGSTDGTLRIQDGTSGEILKTLKVAKGISMCSISGDGGRILSTAADDGLKVWDTERGSVIFATKEWGDRAVISSDGRQFLSLQFGRVSTHDATNGHLLQAFSSPLTYFQAAAFSAGGERVVLGDWLGTLTVGEVATGGILMTLGQYYGRVQGCALSLDGGRMVTGSPGGALWVFDSETGELLRTLEERETPLTCCSMSIDGRHIVSGYQDGTVRLWDAATGHVLRTCVGLTTEVTSASISLDGQYIVAMTMNSKVCVWDAKGNLRMTFDVAPGLLLACTISADNRRVIEARSDGTLRSRAMRSGAVRTTRKSGMHSMVCAVSPDRDRFVFGSIQGRLKVLTMSSNKVLLTLEDGDDLVTTCAVSRDGHRILSGTDDGTLRLWDGVTGKLLHKLSGHRGSVTDCGLSADDSRLVSTASDGTIRVWDGTTGALLMTIGRFAGDEFVVFEERPTRRIRRVSPNGWRSVGWVAEDPETGAVRRYPAESFGPLPGADDERDA